MNTKPQIFGPDVPIGNGDAAVSVAALKYAKAITCAEDVEARLVKPGRLRQKPLSRAHERSGNRDDARRRLAGDGWTGGF